jgi:hypothetical protein
MAKEGTKYQKHPARDACNGSKTHIYTIEVEICLKRDVWEDGE